MSSPAVTPLDHAAFGGGDGGFFLFNVFAAFSLSIQCAQHTRRSTMKSKAVPLDPFNVIIYTRRTTII